MLAALPPGSLHAVGQRLVQFLGAEFVDQGHGALGDAVGQQEVVIHRRDHIHDRIAQARDIVFLRHDLLRTAL